MIYNNDESDKIVRRKNFHLTVYALPFLLGLGISSLIFLASTKNYLSKIDTYYGYFLSLAIGLPLSLYNKRNWLKMSDGTYHNVKGILPQRKVNINEPTDYVGEYFYSQKETRMSILLGIVLTGVGVWLGLKELISILILLCTIIMGLFFSYNGIKGLLDKSAKLKIATNGLWTNKLGFVNWDDINFAEVVEDNRDDTRQSYLEIYLKGTKFEVANMPDEILLLSDLENYEDIEMIINNSIFKYNEQKK